MSDIGRDLLDVFPADRPNLGCLGVLPRFSATVPPGFCPNDSTFSNRYMTRSYINDLVQSKTQSKNQSIVQSRVQVLHQPHFQ